MTPEQTASERIAQFVTGLTLEDIPASVLHRAKLHFLDTLGAGIAGAASKEAAISTQALAAATGQGFRGGATLWGTPVELPALAAAFVNGVASHAFELDDSGGCDHSGAVVIPAALAAVSLRTALDGHEFSLASHNVDGGLLLRAIVTGYEIARRVQDALGGYDAVNNAGWHSTGVCGTFGAAVAAGVILELDASQMTSAIGLAGSFTGGTWSFIGDGAMSKRMHVGRASEAGLNSALLAKTGFTGPRDLFSAPWGSFLRLYSGDQTAVDEAKLYEALGTDWRIEWASIKPYATCRSTHSAIDAVLALRGQHGLDAESITSMTVYTSTLIADMCGKADTGSLVSTQLSMQFGLAAALLHGEVGLSQISKDSRTDPRILDLINRIHVVIDHEQHGGSAEPRIEVETRNRSFVIQAVRAKGASTNRLSDDETIAKFVRLAETRLPLERVKKLSGEVMHLTALDDLTALLQLLKADSQPALLV